MSTPSVEETGFELRHRLPLDDPNTAWKIEQGSVDLFLVDLEDAEAKSSLEFVATLMSGEVIIGLGAIGHGAIGNGIARTTLIAQPSPGTYLRALRLDGVRAGEDAVRPDQIDAWINTLADAVSPGMAPLLSRQIDAGDQIETGEDGLVLIGNRSVSWMMGARTPLTIYGVSPASADDIYPFPICRNLWVHAGPGEILSSISTEEWLNMARAEGLVADHLRPLHQAILQLRATQRERRANSESLRFQEKISRDGKVFGTALRQLLSPLLPEVSGQTEFVEDHDNIASDSAFNAASEVGARIGIPIVRPTEVLSNETAPEAVIRIANASSTRYRRVLLRDQWWKTDQGPMIGFTLNGVSAVSFLPKGTSSYIVHDSVAGTRTRVSDDVSAQLDASAYVLYRSFPNQKLTLLDILKFGLRNGRRDLAVILSVSAIVGLLGMAMPIATGVLFDTIIPEGQRNNLVQLSVILFSASVATFLMNLGQSFATQRLEGRMESEMEAAVWDRLLNLRTGFFRQFTTGDLATRSLAINQMRRILTGTAVSALLSGVFSIFSFALLFSYSVSLAFLATGMAAIAVLFSALSTWISIRFQRKTMAMDGKINGRISELLQGIAKFRVSGTEPTAFARWAADYTWQKKTLVSAAKVSMAMGIFDSIFPAATSIVLYLTAANMIKSDPHFTVGHFLAFNAAFGQFLGATLGFSSAVLSVIGIIPTFERAKPILNELPELKPELLDPGTLNGNIELAHVSFRYKEDGPEILKDVSFTIKSGQYVAFVGESGCGKSTIMRLMLGFEKPESGSIFYDGRDLAELDMQGVRKQIGVVLQSGALMAADIHTNIVGASNLSIDVAWDAAKRVGLDDDIRAMPMGMHTVISEAGGGLSGGQKQRITIARAIVHRPRILFFDEATSALDNQTQAIVSESLDAMQATRIVIAHRLSTILHADLILVFKNGQLHEKGTYKELLEANGYFADLAKRQLN
jgi:NHLM bacteriocin system ABC transporter ATP-binding protein